MCTKYPLLVNPSAADTLSVQYARASLPLPRGEFFSQPFVEIKDKAGQVTAAQGETLAHWPDGSLRVLHLTFRGSGGEYEAHVKKDSADSLWPPDAIIQNRNGNKISITTGRLNAVIGGKKLVDSLHLGDRKLVGEGGIEIRVRDAQGRLYLAGAAREVKTSLEVAGPLRTVICLSGKHRWEEDTLLDFRLRFEFLAGVEGVSLSYTFLNVERGQDCLPVQGIELAIRMEDAPSPEYAVCQMHQGIFGIPKLQQTAKPLHINVDTTQSRPYVANFDDLADDTQYPFYLQNGMSDVESWGALCAGKSTFVAEMDDFHLLRPKSLHLENDEICFGIWPQTAGVLDLQQGRSREVTVRLAFLDDKSTFSLETARARIAQMRDYWRAQIPQPFYAATAFFDQSRVFEYNPARYPRFEAWLGRLSSLQSVATFFDLGDTPDSGYLRTYLPLGRQKRVRGEDGGTRWFSTGIHNPALSMNNLDDFEPVWVNNEYDVIFGLGTEYLRTGDFSLFQRLRWFARHTIDVDFLSYSDHQWLHRAQPTHSARHTTTGAYPSHFWTQGLAQYYFLTGDVDALEVIIALADKTIENLEDPVIGKMNSGLNREVGWGILTLVCAYEASGLKRFDDYACKLLQECARFGIPPDIPVFSFGITSLLLGVRQYLQVHEGDDTDWLQSWLLAFVDHAVACSRQAPDPDSQRSNVKTSHYSYDTQLAARGKLNTRNNRTGVFASMSMALDLLAYAYEITGEQKYIETGLRSLESLLDSSIWLQPPQEGKPFAMLYRTWINYFQAAAKLGYLEKFEYEY